jgi:hypothetical protein
VVWCVPWESQSPVAFVCVCVLSACEPSAAVLKGSSFCSTRHTERKKIECAGPLENYILSFRHTHTENVHPVGCIRSTHNSYKERERCGSFSPAVLLSARCIRWFVAIFFYSPFLVLAAGAVKVSQSGGLTTTTTSPVRKKTQKSLDPLFKKLPNRKNWIYKELIVLFSCIVSPFTTCLEWGKKFPPVLKKNL